MTAPELLFVLVGFGRVARRFVRLLGEVDGRLGFRWRVVAIATRGHGSVVDVSGIDALRAAAVREQAGSLGGEGPATSGVNVLRRVADALRDETRDGRLVCIETTALDIERGEPAISHVRAALEGRMHVVSTNKGPAAFAYRELESLAESMDRVFFFEGAVMDGVPVLNLVRETLPAVIVRGFRGVINTTTNFALSALERGRDLGDAIRDMQERGITEADPSLDIDGWDAAAKTAVLVNALMGERITPHLVQRTGIGGVSRSDVQDAVARGRRIRLVASAHRDASRLSARVEPELLDRADPLAGLGDTENALYLRTDLLGEIGIVQRESSLTQTAYALVSDLSRISLRLGEL
jgi:homoserine dehydrogenase